MIQRKIKFGPSVVNIDYENLYPGTYSHNTHIQHQIRLGEEIKSKIQAVSFVHSDITRGYENEMMWAHYAENHRGVCLEIDFDKFIKENDSIPNFKFQNIKYKQVERPYLHFQRRLSKEENIENTIKTQFEVLFLTKSNYWEKEYEKRLLIIDDNHCFLSIRKSLKGIYYGLSTPPEYFKPIEQFVNKKQTKLYREYHEKNLMKRMLT
jgi:hypothetical protein